MRARWKALGASRAFLRAAACWAAWLAAWVRGAATLLDVMLVHGDICKGRREEDIRRIVIGLGKLLFAVIICTSENGTCPVCEEALGLALDGQFGLLALDVEHDDFANARCYQCVFVDG
jgi:hypothetical protein